MKRLARFILLLLMSVHLAHSQAGENSPPLKWKEHFRNGLEALESGQNEQALQHFERAEFESDFPELVYYNQGLSLMRLGEGVQAEDKFKKAIGTLPDLTALRARYNLGLLHADRAIVPSTDPDAPPTLKQTETEQAVNYFRDVGSLAEKEVFEDNEKAQELRRRAEENEKLLLARMKIQNDRDARKKGNRVPFLLGKLNANGRPVEGGWVYFRNKWDDDINGYTRSGPDGDFKTTPLDPGWYFLGGAFYETDNYPNLKERQRVPAYDSDPVSIDVRGALSLACPYQASVPSLGGVFQDRSRLEGPESITSSTDWGELDDGRPESDLPEDTDEHPAYVAFDAEDFQIAFGLPVKQQQQMPQMQQSTSVEPTTPPTYTVTLKGYTDDKVAVPPSTFFVMGMKEGEEKPIPLHGETISTTQKGLYSWTSKEFEQKDCRQLLLGFKRQGGERISFHEIEINEQTHDGNESQPQQQPEDNQEQQGKDKQEQQSQPKDKKKDEKIENILRAIRQKGDENEKRRDKDTVIRAEKDW